MRSFFIHAPLSVRVENVSKRQEIPLQEAEQFIAREEKKRASYYNYFTNKEWGKADSYHFTLDAGLLGLEGCAKAAVELIKKSY